MAYSGSLKNVPEYFRVTHRLSGGLRNVMACMRMMKIF